MLPGQEKPCPSRKNPARAAISCSSRVLFIEYAIANENARYIEGIHILVIVPACPFEL